MKHREIKFRVWDLFTKEMNTDDMQTLISFNSNGVINSNNGFAMNPVMQFTGLKDKNGKEIYEGDIIKLGFDPEGKFPRQIIWEGFGFWCKQINGEGNYPLTMVNITKDANLPSDETDWVVIGNIYENLELLK